MKTLLVIPAYNEEEALPHTVADLQQLPDGYEILVVNDGSRDRTGAVAHVLARTSRLPLHVVELAVNGGIGVAVQTGYLFAARHEGYDYVIQFDADGQHPAESIPALVEACEREGLDVCIGSRFLGEQGDGFRSSFTRRLGIRFFCRLIGFLSGTRVTDPTSGFRCAGPRAWRSFARQYPEDYPEPESLFWCLRNRLRFGEIPVRMRDRQGGVSSIRLWRTVYYMLKVSFSILFDRLRAVEQKPT
ncbi:MAG: glycosyltransferase family 2 protein [Gemmataceae bacterium]|nr:glycosyltransferase family 2 protein [Gemmataceae bacterium]